MRSITRRLNNEVKFQKFVKMKTNEIQVLSDLTKLFRMYQEQDSNKFSSVAASNVKTQIMSFVKRHVDLLPHLQSLFDMDNVKESISVFESERFALYDFQKLIIASFFNLMTKSVPDLVLELPTASGKSAIISTLAHAIAANDTDEDSKVIIVTPTEYLTDYGFEHYAIGGESCCRWPKV